MVMAEIFVEKKLWQFEEKMFIIFGENIMGVICAYISQSGRRTANKQQWQINCEWNL